MVPSFLICLFLFSLPRGGWGYPGFFARGCTRGAAPSALPEMQALRPAPRGVYAGLAAPATPDAGAPREHGFAMLGTRVTFPSRGKSPKARQGLRPLESPEGDRLKSETLFSPAPPAASRNPLDRVSTIKQDRFATLSEWASRPYFSPQATPGVTLSAVNPWRGS